MYPVPSAILPSPTTVKYYPAKFWPSTKGCAPTLNAFKITNSKIHDVTKEILPRKCLSSEYGNALLFNGHRSHYCTCCKKSRNLGIKTPKNPLSGWLWDCASLQSHFVYKEHFQILLTWIYETGRRITLPQYCKKHPWMSKLKHKDSRHLLIKSIIMMIHHDGSDD